MSIHTALIFIGGFLFSAGFALAIEQIVNNTAKQSNWTTWYYSAPPSTFQGTPQKPGDDI